MIVSEKNQDDNQNIYKIEKEVLEVKKPLKLAISKVDDISNLSNTTIFVDEEKISFPLVIRKWQEGDFFYPSGMNGKKKVSKYFKDEKFSMLEKNEIWLLCSNDKIVWIIGKRQDDRFKITETTTKILQINYIK